MELLDVSLFNRLLNSVISIEYYGLLYKIFFIYPNELCFYKGAKSNVIDIVTTKKK